MLALSLFTLFLTAAQLPAATNDLTSLLQQGLFEEEANRNLDAAIASYESLAKQFDKDRQIAATAVFRLGECYRKLGKTNEAVVQYERILRDFQDQQTLVTLSRQNLVGLGSESRSLTAGDIMQANPALSSSARAELQSLMEEEIGLIESKLKNVEQLFATGQVPQSEVTVIRQELLALKRQLVILSANQSATSVASVPGSATGVMTDEEEKEIRRIQEMIRNSPDLINAAGNGGGRPLHDAAEKGQLRVARYLLENGATVDSQNARGETPLMLAASSGHKAMVELLLARGADPNVRGRSGMAALHNAALQGFRAVAEVLLANKANVNTSDHSGRTPLHFVSERGHISVIPSLVDRGADIDARSSGGYTPLHVAASAGHTAVVRALLEAKAEINARNERGQTPLLVAAMNVRGENETARYLLSAGADPRLATTSEPLNVSPLHFAVANGDEVLTRELLERGADPNLWASRRPVRISSSERFGDTDGGSPLMTACINLSNQSLVRLLLERGANPNVQHGDFPLLFTAWHSPELLQLLLEFKADPGQTNKHGWTVLHYMADRPDAPTNGIALLVEHGADLNARDAAGTTPLHVAAGRGIGTTVAALLAFKADPNVRNSEGRTPLDLARHVRPGNVPGIPPGPGLPMPRPGMAPPQTSSPQVVELLRQHGARDDLPNRDRIEVRRPSANYSAVFFTRDTNSRNRFTLLEVLAWQYKLINTSQQGMWETKRTFVRRFWDHDPCRFPDLRRIVIRRPSGDGEKWETLQVDVATLLNTGDCSLDRQLEWGDIVEIPEADHPVNQRWDGLDRPDLDALLKCVSRQVQISIKGTNATLTLQPVYSIPGGGLSTGSGYVDPPFEVTPASYALRSVLDTSKLVRASSDLSRVKVTRRDPAAGRAREWILDCSGNNAPDFWLRDGDVIEVPEK